MMTPQERAKALESMTSVSNAFYSAAIAIGNHPFIEFAGLMNEYIKACREAHEAGVDFSECNTHSGQDLPLRSFQVDYLNEKLECIFMGRSVVTSDDSQLQLANLIDFTARQLRAYEDRDEATARAIIQQVLNLKERDTFQDA